MTVALPTRAGAGWGAVEDWKKVLLTDRWQTIDVDLTPYIRAPGQYEVTFRRLGGSGDLAVRRAVAVMAGTEAPHLIAKLDRPHTWNVNRTAQVTADPKGRTVLRIVARTGRTDPWRGALYVRRVD